MVCGHFGNEVTRIQQYCIIFVYILQGKIGRTEKKWKENQTNQRDQNTKNQKMKIGDERNIKNSKEMFLF